MPDFSAPAAQLWSLLSTSVPIGAGRCVRVTPTTVVQTGPHGDATGAKTLSINVGIEGEIVIGKFVPSQRPRTLHYSARDDRSRFRPARIASVEPAHRAGDVANSLLRTLASAEVKAGRSLKIR
ncbi:MAG: hypothetical protein U0165_19555 [Polyangiaceae bacterium]